MISVKSNLSYSKKTRQICKNQRIILNKRYIKLLQSISKDMDLPSNLLVGIYLIETYYRPWYIRNIEFIVTIFGMIKTSMLKKPFKNYTIGRCQIGISYILKFNGKDIYKHVRKINSIKTNDFICVINSMHYRTNFYICGKMVKNHYEKSKNVGDYNLMLRHIGQAYNGRYSYGLLLEEVVSYLDNDFI